MEQLTITEKSGANYFLFELDGALNAYTLAEFQQKVYGAIQKNNVVVDLSKVVELDSSGVGVLMAAFNDGEDLSHKLYLMALSNESEKAIDQTGFTHELNIINSVTEVA
ncbi:MAG: STAS domain-containing protein [Treponema sp.]|nr:STAS domain-containing protein [Treponema sp.]